MAQPDRAQLRQIQTFIEENLTDPALTLLRVAGGFLMSTRTLHRLSARHGLTVSARIKRLTRIRSPGASAVTAVPTATRASATTSGITFLNLERAHRRTSRGTARCAG
ncbi:hypothetical protein AMETH_1182 [Amycolatopsis methanolica 239]|uniref:Uncharacterized protein n=1 Tax=Amycolatopsis methanolica 239 TaxID=1068978 RepID=A0A076MKL3_AMYME|nr:hypothetical protein [Amycolatopsis methanolica]AIJ21274.1 hypothetical protein AMETH_1182 [Amycolatopsis methanolica 239]